MSALLDGAARLEIELSDAQLARLDQLGAALRDGIRELGVDTRFEVVPNVVDIERFHPGVESERNGGPRRLIGVGGLLYSSMVRWLIRTLGERGLVTVGGLLGSVFFALLVAITDWAFAIPCTIVLGVAFYLIHNTIQTKAIEVAPEARGSAVALYASAWGAGQAFGVGAMGLAVAFFSYALMIALFGLGFGLLGLWLRFNLWRLRP